MTIELGWWMMPFVVWPVLVAVTVRNVYKTELFNLFPLALGAAINVFIGWCLMAAARWL